MNRSHTRVVTLLSAVGLTTLMSPSQGANAARREVGSLVKGTAGVTLTADSARPVATAAETLVSEYGYVITYEDPRYEYDDDLTDVTAESRRDLDRYPAGRAPKVLGPTGGRLQLSIAEPSKVDDMGGVLNQVLRAQTGSVRGGHFRVLRTGKVFHILPTEIRDRNGNWSVVSSILDAAISLPAQELTDSEMIATICNAVSAASHVSVNVGLTGFSEGGISAGETQPHRYHLQADSEPARQVLMRALDEVAPDRGRQTWVLLYDRSPTNSYYLSLLPVPNTQTPPKETQPTLSAPAAVPQHRPTDVR